MSKSAIVRTAAGVLLAGIALLGIAGTADAASTLDTAAGEAPANTAAMVLASLALSESDTAPDAFRACIAGGQDVTLPGTFVGVECEAGDGERWYAGLVWMQDGTVALNTGP